MTGLGVAAHEHEWRVQQGGSAITNSEPAMRFKVCKCGEVVQISYEEADALLRAATSHPGPK